MNNFEFGSGSGFGYGTGYNSGFGYGDGSGYGYGTGYNSGDGYGYDYGSDSGYGAGYNSGFGDTDSWIKIGQIRNDNVSVLSQWPYMKIGEKIKLLKDWKTNEYVHLYS